MTGAGPQRFLDGVDESHRRSAAGGVVASPGGHVVASTAVLPEAPPGPLTRFGLAVTTGVPAEPDVAEPFARALLELHRELLSRILDDAVEHLGGRTSDGASLLARQLVQAQLADAAIRLAEIAAMPPERRDAGPADRGRTHQRLVAIGRDLLRLLGASGFLADGPAGALHVAEVLGDVYLNPGTEDSHG